MSSGYEDCKCGKPRTDNKWCQSCSSDYFKKQFGKWTSGNKAVDKFIQDTQLNAKSSDQVLELVSFEKEIFDVEHLAVGGYGTVYKAKWMSGPIKYYDVSTQRLCRSGKSGGTDIILKGLKDSKNVNEEFFEEVFNLIIVNRGRPDIYENITPKIIIDLINSCWNENPKDRPKAIDLRNKLSKYKETWTEIDENQNFEILPTEAPLNYKISEQASYISRLLPTYQINQ
ncbi:17764_t:CDS:2 [Dentiscutata erythropus]|uniref:17764_t:CDS:1 n=1 Tax=Dentiscutata erythropus TaxID=1348616 RepID=A0A9N9AYP9_9GLOM|nr:17764_t:CDS:2 [Dentiscutata erythropus]